MTIKQFHNHPLVTIASYVLLVFFIVLAVKAYLWYLTISQTIRYNEEKNTILQEKISFLRDYRLAYLHSEYADYFMSHENGIAHPNERIYKIVKKSEIVSESVSMVSPNGDVKKPNGTGKGRLPYLKYKIERIQIGE